MTDESVVERFLRGDASLFSGDTAAHSLGWLTHPERYLGDWLLSVSEALPRRHRRTILLGMGGSSSPARLYAEGRPECPLNVLDTSNPDAIAEVDFSDATVIASSKSGGTIETQTLLAHALRHGLQPQDLVIITDPGTTLDELGASLGAMVVAGDPNTGGRFSAISPFGLIPAIYAGWSPDELRDSLSDSTLSHQLVVRAVNHADALATVASDGSALFALGADPVTSGGALWLEQLIAETTGKMGRGFIPVLEGRAQEYGPGDIMYWQLVAALLARHLGVDPFNQPDVERAKKVVFALLSREVSWTPPPYDAAALHEALRVSTYVALQVYGPLSLSEELVDLRSRTEGAFGPTSASLGPRYLHSTGQLHKGGPRGVVGLQVVVRPQSAPVRIAGRGYTFHDLHMAQAQSDLVAMREADRPCWQLVVDDLDEAASILGLQS